MTEPLATIAIPSNRPLAGAREAIESALAVCRTTGFELVVSDNSRDSEKAAWLDSLGADVAVIADAPAEGKLNMLSAYRAARGRYLLPMADDDRIDGNGAFDLAPFHRSDLSGIRPLTRVTDETGDILREASDRIAHDQAGARLAARFALREPDNALFYAFWERNRFLSIAELYARSHPTGMGSTDWAMVAALVASGPLEAEPGLMLTYRSGRWSHHSGIAEGRAALIAGAGLRPETASLMPLLHALDTIAYLDVLPITETDRTDAGQTAMTLFLRDVARAIFRDQERFSFLTDLLEPLVATASHTPLDVDEGFRIACLVADRLKPDLGQGYEAMRRAAIQSAGQSRKA